MRSAAYLVCGLVGGLAGGLLVHVLRAEPPARARSGELRAGRTADPEEIERRLWERIEARLDREARPAADAPGRPGTAAPAAPVAGGESGEPATPAGGEANRVALGNLMADLAARRYDSEALGSLWAWMSREKNTKRIPEVIEALQAELKRDPDNADLWTALATAFTGQLSFNTPPGAQQGLVWARAVGAYDKAIALAPEHWNARFGKAFGTTFIPKQFGMRPVAIRQFEELRRIQERRAPEPRFARTYLQLGMLYKEEGNLEKARAIWEQGLKLFPDNGQLKAQVEVSTGR